MSTVSVLRLNALGAHTITGLVPPVANIGWVYYLFNISDGATEIITLTHDDAASTAANRFFLPNNASLQLLPRSGVILWYDSIVDRWFIIGGGI